MAGKDADRTTVAKEPTELDSEVQESLKQAGIEEAGLFTEDDRIDSAAGSPDDEFKWFVRVSKSVTRVRRINGSNRSPSDLSSPR